MIDHRIKNKPATSCDDFDLVQINDYGGSLAMGMKWRDKCDIYVLHGVYKEQKMIGDYEFVKGKVCYGFIIKQNKERVMNVLNVIDWFSYAVPVMGGTYKLSKDIIITAYNDFLRNEKWHIDYINHYEKHKCKTTE